VPAPAALVVDDGRGGEATPDLDRTDAGLRATLGAGTTSIAYVLAGVPRGGSGGAISVIQEAAELGRLGADVRILLPADAVAPAAALHPAAAPWLRGVVYPAGLRGALADADVVVTTEAGTVAAIAEHAPPGAVRACYVQDYEALFARPASELADAALLSYQRGSPGAAFAKTHWLANLVATAHGIPVGKVDPSLDRDLFHQRGRPAARAATRVIAMIRPRTARRRPAATLALLRRVALELDRDVECLAFGCDLAELDELAAGDTLDWLRALGVLGRTEVADVMRRCDLFVDLSVYQAFGRTGLEAMACGAVPVLPRLGGAVEYAVHGRNALLVDDADGAHAALATLIGDPERVEEMRRDGARTAARYSLTRAAVSQYAFLTGAAA
jgi:glycosyltransferase involved in cell wall biosynthesis